MRSVILFIFLGSFCLSISAQSLNGKVVNEAGEPIPFVAIGIIGTQVMASTDDK